MSSEGTNASNASRHPYAEHQRGAEEKHIHPVRYYSRKIGGAIILAVIGCPLFVCFCCLDIFCHNGGGGLCGTGALQAATRKWEAQHRKSNIPRALYHHQINDKKHGDTWSLDERALSRRRRLSSDQRHNAPVKSSLVQRLSGSLIPRPKQYTRAIPRSGFLNLPLEVRLIIWKYAVGGRTIHLFYGTPVSKQPYVFPLKASVLPIRIKRKRKDETIIKRLSSVECIHRPDPTGWANRCPSMLSCEDCGVVWNLYGECHGKVIWTPTNGTEAPDDADSLGDMEIIAANTGWRPLALLQTCKMIYDEAIALLYATNTFHFAEERLILHFPITILPTRLSLVTSVSVEIDLYYTGPLHLGELPSHFTNLRSVQIHGQELWGEGATFEQSERHNLPFNVLRQIADKVGQDGQVLVSVSFDEGHLRNPEEELPQQLRIDYETAETRAMKALFDERLTARRWREDVGPV